MPNIPLPEKPSHEGFHPLAISVEQFAGLLSVSKRSARTIIENEALFALREARANRLPLLSPVPGGQTRRLRMSDVQRWLDGLR